MKQLQKSLWFVLLLGAQVLWAQQEPMQTQFMFNKLSYNPGYAGSFESPTLTVLNRHQWVGIEGAPNNQVFSFTQPLLSNHFGLGLNLTRQSITINRSISAELSYAYQMALPRGYLGIGLMVSMRQFRQNWMDDRIITSQPTSVDNGVPDGIQGKLVPNFGFGVFYTGPRWYAGASVPRLVANNIDFSQKEGILSREVQQLNLMTGVAFDVSDGVTLTPQMLFRYVFNAPPDLDVNVMASIQEKFHTGITYRVGGDTNNFGESVDVMAGVQATSNLMVLLSYDIGLTLLRRFHNGSIEATARWWFNPPEGNQVVNPNRPF
jgi:type IX secretion system PorP/SprF family membrane protein